ncbi:MAG: polysaccharide deacetylase family protein [Patescibacteria group bacterium]
MIKIVTKPNNIEETREELLPIFFEPTGVRWKISKIIFVVLTLVGLLLAFALSRYYFMDFNANNTINAYAKEFDNKKTSEINKVNTFAIFSPDYSSKYVFGALKENSTQLKSLVLKPFINGKFVQDGGYNSALSYKNISNPYSNDLLIDKATSEKSLDTLFQTPEMKNFISNNDVDKVIYEVSSQSQIDQFKVLSQKYNQKIGFLINKPQETTLNFGKTTVYYLFNYQEGEKLNSQIDSFSAGLNRLIQSGAKPKISIQSQYTTKKDNETKIVAPFEVQDKLKSGDVITMNDNIPTLKINDQEVKMFGKWFYFNFFTILGDRLPKNVEVGLSSLENAESGSLKFLNERKIKGEFTLSDKIKTSGKGLIQNVKNYGSQGAVTAESDLNTKLLKSVKIEKLPVPAEIEYTGYIEKTTAITFDDGPAVINTPKVLEILKRYNAQATFFVTGAQVNKHPDTLRLIAKEGHQIENHTYSHRNLANVSEQQMRFEISETNKLIKENTNYSPRFLRVPYDAFGIPETIQDLTVNRIAEEFNMKLYQIDTDSKDYASEAGSKDDVTPEAFKIEEIKTQILFHDGWDGEKKNTFKKIENTLELLTKNKYNLITVNQYVNKNETQVVKIREDNIFEKVLHLNSSEADLIVGSYNVVINVILFIGSFTVIAFILFLFRNKFLQPKEDFYANVTALIPCYNEEKMVISTVQSLLNNDLPGLKILVVDDGSKDRSFIYLKKTYANNPRVKIITKPNGGKSTALNYGLSFVDTEYFVTMDSDTIFAKDSVRLMLRHFADPKVSAVAGNVQIGNEYFTQKHSDKSVNFFSDFNWLTTCQRFEYITGQNFEKLAFNGMGCVIVVPGAIGCFKTADVRSIGGYKEDTLAEDTNLTIELLKQGKKVRYEPNALCFTEAPDTIQQFFKQRFRWSFGTFQVAWKNKNILFNPRYGSLSLFALPYMVFGLANLISLPLTSIGLFIIMIRSILGFAGVITLNQTDTNSLIALFGLFILFTLISILRVTYSLWKDKSENKYQILLAYPIVITVYNALIAYITIKAFFACIKGQRQGWGHLVRKGSVKMSQLSS